MTETHEITASITDRYAAAQRYAVAARQAIADVTADYSVTDVLFESLFRAEGHLSAWGLVLGIYTNANTQGKSEREALDIVVTLANEWLRNWCSPNSTSKSYELSQIHLRSAMREVVRELEYLQGI